MNGTLALLVALVSYGNEYLSQGKSLHKLDFNNSTLIYCNTLEFKDSNSSSSVIANNPQEWFGFLKKNGCKRLKIYFQHSNESQSKDFQTSALVGGGGIWMIEASYNKYSNYWDCTESVTNEDAKDNRIWKIQFTLIKKNQHVLDKQTSVDNTKNELAISLNKIMAFASKHGLEHWANVFKKAKANLNSSHPAMDYYKDCIIEDQFSLKSKQLLFSASIADVFGGMGSWNDMMFSNPEEEKLNQELSADLYDKINQSITVAVNSK
jgi:hypothetical protein